MIQNTVIFLVSTIADIEAGNAPTLGDIAGLVVSLINRFAFSIVPIGLVAYVIYAGAQRMMAGSDPKKVATANETLLWAVLGSLTVMGSIVIVNIFLALAGIDGGLGSITNPF